MDLIVLDRKRNHIRLIIYYGVVLLFSLVQLDVATKGQGKILFILYVVVLIPFILSIKNIRSNVGLIRINRKISIKYERELIPVKDIIKISFEKGRVIKDSITIFTTKSEYTIPLLKYYDSLLFLKKVLSTNKNIEIDKTLKKAVGLTKIEADYKRKHIRLLLELAGAVYVIFMTLFIIFLCHISSSVWWDYALGIIQQVLMWRMLIDTVYYFYPALYYE